MRKCTVLSGDEMDAFKNFLDSAKESYTRVKIRGEWLQEIHLLEKADEAKYQVIRVFVRNLKTSPERLEKLANSNDPIVKAIVAEELTITPDMPEELVKKLVELAEKLANDPHWFVRAKLAGNTNIDSDIFWELAGKLAEDKDWRVLIALIRNDHIPTEIREKLKKDNAKLLDEVEEIRNQYEKLLKRLLRS